MLYSEPLGGYSSWSPRGCLSYSCNAGRRAGEAGENGKNGGNFASKMQEAYRPPQKQEDDLPQMDMEEQVWR